MPRVIKVVIYCTIYRGDPDYSGNVVSNASFSKLFGPGLRLGWLEAPLCVRNVICHFQQVRSLRPSLIIMHILLTVCSGLAFSGGGLNHFTSGLMTSIISEGLLQKHLTEARAMYNVCLGVRAYWGLWAIKAPWVWRPGWNDHDYERLSQAAPLKLPNIYVRISWFIGAVWGCLLSLARKASISHVHCPRSLLVVLWNHFIFHCTF